MNTTSAWTIFERDFKKGDEVILIDDNEMFDWGTLDYNEQEIILTSGLRPARHYPHHKIVFLCHDGFPVRKFLAPWPHETFDTQLIPDVMRAALACENVDNLAREIKSIEKAAAKLGVTENVFYSHETVKTAVKVMKTLAAPFLTLGKMLKEAKASREYAAATREYRVSWGHPIEINPVSLELYNPGNGSEWFWSNHPFEEVLAMTCNNGLKAQLWELSGVYHFEIM